MNLSNYVSAVSMILTLKKTEQIFFILIHLLLYYDIQEPEH